MRSKPLVMENLYLEKDNLIVDFKLDNNITILTGDAGIGKTVVFNMIKEMMETDNRIFCLNYKNSHHDILEIIRACDGKFAVVDNADILLSNEVRKFISLDSSNQYLLIGRNPKNLFATKENIFELRREKSGNKTRFYIAHF